MFLEVTDSNALEGLEVKNNFFLIFEPMVNNIFISYVIPCYNIQDYVPRCIKSLEHQKISEQDLEFIFINDGSTDKTLSLIKEFADRDHRAIVIDQLNQGVSVARNNGIRKARGKYVFFLDGDDWMTDDASEIMYEFCKDSSPDVALFSHYKVFENRPENREVWIDCSRHCKTGIYSRNTYVNQTSYIPISQKLYKTDFLQSNKIEFDEQLRVGEVYTFFIHALTLSKTIGVSDKYIMYYLKREGNSATTEVNLEKDLSALDTLHTINKYVNENYSDLQKHRCFLAPLFFMITAFTLIKYVGRGEYTKEKGKLMSIVKKDPEYRSLLRFFTTNSFSLDKYSFLASSIRFFPAFISYNILRSYYKFATRGRE